MNNLISDQCEGCPMQGVGEWTGAGKTLGFKFQPWDKFGFSSVWDRMK